MLVGHVIMRITNGKGSKFNAIQQLVRLMLLKMLTRQRARAKLPRLLELLDQFRESPLRALAKTLTSWLEPIVAMWRFSKNNGITEGFHNKMEMISRRASGFRNFENYRLRVLTHCGWDGIINRVRMNARPPFNWVEPERFECSLSY